MITPMAKTKPVKKRQRQLQLPNVPKGKAKATGNPFFALRVPAALLTAYCRKVGGRPNACARVREHMERVVRS